MQKNIRKAKKLYEKGEINNCIDYLSGLIKTEPNFVEAYMILGSCYARSLDWDIATQYCLKAVEKLNSRDVLRHLVDTLKNAEINGENYPGLTNVLIQCFEDDHINSQDLVGLSFSILKGDTKDFSNPLFKNLLTRTIVCDPDYELFLTKVRKEFFLEGKHRDIIELVSIQCLINGHIWHTTNDENVKPKLSVIDFALYIPISQWISFVDLDKYLNLGEFVANSLALNKIRQDYDSNLILSKVTLAVKNLYEDHPFPAWLSTTILPPMSVRAFLSYHFPEFQVPFFFDEKIRVLIAGCGTGKQAIDFALRHPDSEVIAIDLSAASLAYARSMAEKYNVPNLFFRQLDIYDAERLGEKFHLIECSGVLNHVEKPLDAWKILAELLVPKGIMYIGLYSRVARIEITEAQNYLKVSGESIDNFRQKLITNRDSKLARELLKWPDFYSKTGFHDLILHVNEHTFDLQMIKKYLDLLNLKFIGFLFSSKDVISQFKAEFLELNPKDPTNWSIFEARHQETFRHLYCFYCQR